MEIKTEKERPEDNTESSQEEPENAVFQALLQIKPPKPVLYSNAVTLGKLAGFEEGGMPLVTFPQIKGNAPVKARSTIKLSRDTEGREVTLVFEAGDYQNPIITGIIKAPEEINPVDIHLDGDRLVLEGKKEIVLKCGKASITLTKAGKVLIRGAYLLNRSSGVNRIKGGSVQIN